MRKPLSAEDNRQQIDCPVEASPQSKDTVQVGAPPAINGLLTRLNALVVGLRIVHHSLRTPDLREPLIRNVQAAKAFSGGVLENGMDISNLSLVPLRQASLCLDCETITTASANCQACGSQALLNVARTLNRPRRSDLASSGRTGLVGYSRRGSANRTPFTGHTESMPKLGQRFRSQLARELRSPEADTDTAPLQMDSHRARLVD
jgi:hypothetical protein